MENKKYYISKLKECFYQRQRKNKRYSLRAFASDVEVHPSTLSQVLKYKRELPLKSIHTVASRLKLSSQELTLFMESFYKTKTNIDKIAISELDRRFILGETYHKIIAEWEHYAILELLDFSPNLQSVTISKKLGISQSRSDVVIENLVSFGLLRINSQGLYEKIHDDIKTTEDIKSKALVDSHKETLQLGLEKIDEIEIEFRDFSSTTLGVDLEKISEAKTIIREFRQKMTALLRTGNKTDVYQLAIQFYPLTKMENIK